MTEERRAPARSPQVVMTELDDGSGVLLSLETKFYFTLNPTGVFVWKALAAEPRPTIAELGAALARAFEVEPEVASRDVEALLEELAHEGLVR